jgi:hypothetical protein
MPCYTKCHARYWRFIDEPGGTGGKVETGEKSGTGETGETRGSKFEVFGTSNSERHTLALA